MRLGLKSGKDKNYGEGKGALKTVQAWGCLNLLKGVGEQR